MNIEIILAFRQIGKLFVLICAVAHKVNSYFLSNSYSLKLLNFAGNFQVFTGLLQK